MIPILHVDVFTDHPFAGNPAAAVLGADTLSDSQMQSIAAEMRLAGTAFITAPTRSDADLRLRMFTPKREVAYSGHTTVAAVHALLETGRPESSRMVFDTLGGLLTVGIERRVGGVLYWLEPRVPECPPYREPLDDVLDALGLSGTLTDPWASPATTPDADLLLPVRDLDALRALAPDMNRLGRLAEDKRLRGVCVVSPETVEPASAIHSRFFAPHYGIPEDIVTGSVHSSLGIWLLEAGRLRIERDLAAFTAEQGDMLGRPGRLAVEVYVEGGRPVSVRVGGRAVTVLSGSLRLP